MVREVRVTVVDNDAVGMGISGLLAEHGVSFYIEAKGREGQTKILVDTGTSQQVILHNLETMEIDIKNLDVIVLSHGHYDHTGGLLGILKSVERRIPVIAHPKIFAPKFSSKSRLVYTGPPYSPEDVEREGGVLLLARNSVEITKGVVTSGEIERIVPYERVEGFSVVENGEFLADSMPDDQALFINLEGKGLVIVTGCAHSGLINTIHYAQKLTGIDRIYAVIGGFHLIKASTNRINKTIEELEKINFALLAPCHCTGTKATFRFLETFKEKCKPIVVGDKLKL